MLLCCLSALTACGSGAVDVAVTSPRGEAKAACMAWTEDLPRRVAGQDTRTVEPAGALAGAWGDPPILARCGVAKPAGLRPTSTCHVVNGVGWHARRDEGGFVFTTIGRRASVEVAVPETYEPAASALVDLAASVKRHLPVVQPCV